jgi:hypothetical protein
MKRRKRACGCESHAIPSVIQCAVYLSQREVDTLEKGDKVGSQSLPALFFMPAKTNTLKVRRIDLLEQLEERYAWMTKEKEKYERQKAEYDIICDKYFKAVEKWEACIPDALEKALKKAEVTWSERRYGRSEHSYTASARVDMDLKDLELIIGPYPIKPEYQVERPPFLQTRYGTYREGALPCVYDAVYQTIKLLSLSDDETVAASTYQVALEVL